MKNSPINYEFIKDAKRIKELIEEHFDDCFWEDLLTGDNLKNELDEGHEFILFSQDEEPCALVNMGSSFEDVANSKEICQIDVEDNIFGRGYGIGSRIVEILKNTIYSGINLYGYSVSQSAKFWAKHASKLDEDILSMFKEAHVEDGYEEDELYECEGLMLFWL